MRTFKNSNGHLVIEISQVEVVSKLGGIGICDYCNNADVNGFLCPALGQKWYCQGCYKSWEKTAKFYKEDVAFERRAFESLCSRLEIDAPVL